MKYLFILTLQLLYVLSNQPCYNYNDQIYSLDSNGFNSYSLTDDNKWIQLKEVKDVKTFTLDGKNQQLLYINKDNKLTSLKLDGSDIKEVTDAPNNNDLSLTLNNNEQKLYSKDNDNNLYELNLNDNKFSSLLNKDDNNQVFNETEFQYYNNQLLFVGGLKQILNEIQVYDLNKKEWKKQKINGDIPQSRKDFNIQIINNYLYIIGGINDDNQPLNDNLWKLDLNKFKWSNIKLSNTLNLFNYKDIQCQLIVKDKFYTLTKDNTISFDLNNNNNLLDENSVVILNHKNNNNANIKDNYFVNKVLIALGLALGINGLAVITFLIFIAVTKKMEDIMLGFKTKPNRDNDSNSSNSLEAPVFHEKQSWVWNPPLDNSDIKLN